MKQVNLKEILKRHIGEYVNSPVSPNVLLAMQEACNQAIDLCAENAKSITELHPRFGYVTTIDKESILNTKKQII